jgi:hypothetical protein
MKKPSKKTRALVIPGEAAPVKAPKAKRLTGEQLQAAEAVELATKRLAAKREKAEREKRDRKRRDKTHAVENDVHSGNNTERQLDSRSEVERDSDAPIAWRRASQLSAPDPRPGFSQKWVRFKAGNEEDTDNLDRYLEEGWLPRSAENVRKGHELTANAHGKFSKFIVKRGLILMEIGEAQVAQRNRYYQKRADRMTEGVDQDMFKLDNRVMPLLKPARTTRVDKNVRRGARLEDRMPADD